MECLIVEIRRQQDVHLKRITMLPMQLELMSEILARNGLRTQFQVSAMCTLIYRTQKAGGGGINFIPYIP